MEGTFKVIRRPFVQLFSLHTFVKCDNNVKQVPLVFVLMSRRQAKDYRAVFKELRGLVNIKWDVIVSDFEAALWRATREIYPGAVHRGIKKDQKVCRRNVLSAKRPHTVSSIA